MRYASKRLRRGALRKHVLSLVSAHHSFIYFLLAARPRLVPTFTEEEGYPLFRSRVASEGCVLLKLNFHGPHFAVLLKNIISEFAGVPTGNAWVSVQHATTKLEGTVMGDANGERGSEGIGDVDKEGVDDEEQEGPFRYELPSLKYVDEDLDRKSKAALKAIFKISLDDDDDLY